MKTLGLFLQVLLVLLIILVVLGGYAIGYLVHGLGSNGVFHSF